ncbi:hypothetical protein [Cylindrospermum sp. FACHB-282]|uniref:hypothetical protein n=1 Tax=Cylindrospermum sp. FACHB-282 TaxID=2692794 RepID=UPI0016878008|nr:hypothetical protein [Cylindrospermum sp. FACHB-282]MBD2384078.1 hypothetical protein [Cylindrospermum sp. FACHB-282]
MGFADLSIAEIAADYSIPVEKVFSLCNQLGIAYKHQKTRLALEDAKAILSQIQILSETHPKGTSNLVGDTEVT